MNRFSKLFAGAVAGLSGVVFAVTQAFAAISLNPCDTSQTGFQVPCFQDIGQVVTFAINTLLFVSFIAALVFLIIGGIRWIMSGCDKEGTAKAKGTVTSALIGLVVVLGAWVLVNVALQLLTGKTLSTLTLPSLQETGVGTSTGTGTGTQCVVTIGGNDYPGLYSLNTGQCVRD